MAKSTRASKSPAKKAAAGTKAKAERKSKSPAKKSAGGGLVSIEACKQYLAENGSDAVVEINKTKPGRGNFVVTVEGKEKPVLELLGMKRPFKDLKALEMDDIGKLVMEALEEK